MLSCTTEDVQSVYSTATLKESKMKCLVTVKYNVAEAFWVTLSWFQLSVEDAWMHIEAFLAARF